MAPVSPLSPPSTSNDSDDFADDSDDSTHLRQMYKRYMLNPSVAQWLLARDTLTDFHVLRKENSVLISTSSASSPSVIPQHTPDVPFPASSDLMFLDHVQDGFALGHIWGSLPSHTHPYAPLAIRAGKSGWDRVHIRKFACDLAVDGALEIVEFIWFTDNRAMVVLSKMPYQPGTRAVRTSEVLFFDSLESIDIPPQTPSLVLLLHDRSMCRKCGKAICCCPNTIGIERATAPTCRIAQENVLSGGKTVSASTIVRSWEDRARVVSHGNKRGLLSIVYNGSFIGDFSQITVRQTYVSTCEDQDAIEFRIQQHLTKLLSRMPPVSLPVTVKQTPAITNASPFNPAQECGNTVTQVGSSQSPMSFTPKGGQWFGIPRENIFPASQEKHGSLSDRGKQDCCSSPTQTMKLNMSGVRKRGTSWNQKVESDSAAGCTASSKRARERHASGNGSTSGAHDILSGSAATQNVRSEGQDSFQVSLCGPEKARKDCDCSAEKMPNSSLAHILNSGREQVVSHGIGDMASFIEPIFSSSTLENSSQGAQKMNPTTLVANMSTQGQRRVGRLTRGPQPYGAQSSKSTKCGTATTLPSPLPPASAPALQVEPALKRPRTDSPMKPDSFGFGIDAAWSSGLEDRDKLLPTPTWNGAGGNIERPFSALSRAFGVARSHSPFALISPFAKTPSPRATAFSGQDLTFAKTNSAEFDLHNTFDPLPIQSMTEVSKKGDNRVNLQPQTNVVSGKQHKSRAGRSRNTGTSAKESAVGNGVCCDICGIKFAKRSNKMRHIQTVHNRVKQFECDLCGTKFGLKADLGRHRFRIHESRAFRCDSCGKSFAEQEQLEHHVRVTHEEDSRPWECKTCRMRFGRKSSLTRHEQTVHQQTRFVCRFCKKSYSQRFDAVRHERRVHGVHDKEGSAQMKQLTS